MEKLKGTAFWGAKLNRDPSTAKRYMKKGIILNASQTPGGHWRAPYSEEILQLVIERLEAKSGYSYSGFPSEITKPFEELFTHHSPVKMSESRHFRIACALTLAEKGEPVTFEHLTHIDELFRESLSSKDPLRRVKVAITPSKILAKYFEHLNHSDGLFRERLSPKDASRAAKVAATQSKILAKYIPTRKYLEMCKKEVEGGRAKFIALVTAHAHALADSTAEITGPYWERALNYWQIIWGKKIANQANQEWYVDDNDCFLPRLKWKQASPSTFHRICPREMQIEAYRSAAALLGIIPPDLPEPKQREQKNHEPLLPRCSQ